MIEVDIVATIEGLSTRILTPSGQVIDETTVEAIGGQFIRFTGGARQDSPLLSGIGEPGFHSFYRFPAFGSGLYTAQFDAGPGLAESVAVIVQASTNSDLGAALLATETQVVVEESAVLAAAVFEGGRPVSGASVDVSLRAPDGTYSALPLRDDGQDPDELAGDGLYSGEFAPSQPGRYGAVGRIAGATAAGLPFARQVAAQLVAVGRSSRLTGIVSDQGYDDDGDGLFNRVNVEAETSTEIEGSYRLFVTLETASGKRLVRSGDATLAVGRATVGADFEADALVALGEGGPYRLSSLELMQLTPAGADAADRLLDAGLTQPYSLSQFEGFPLDVTPPTIMVTLSPDSLWPPNHQMVEISATVGVSDAQAPSPAVRLVSIVSNEGDKVVGDGNTSDDIQGAALGTDDRQFLLCAERSGKGSGRIYTVTYEAMDAAGNTARASATVTVAHNR